MGKKIINLTIVVLVMIICGCNSRNKTFEKLVLVDSLLEQENLDSATRIMDKLKNIPKRDKDIQAYYYLLSTRLDYMMYRPKMSDSLLNKSIAFYTNQHTNNKLAICYYYKGAIRADMGDFRNAIIFMKKSKKLIEPNKNSILENKICKQLSMINGEAGEYKLAMKYAKECLFFTKKTKKFQELVDIYNRMAIAYGNLSQLDSARYYINMCIPLLDYTDNNIKVVYLDNIGYFNMDTNPQLALKYLNMAMKIGPSADTYDNLAQVYIKLGQKEKADSLWDKALQTKNILKRNQIVATMLRQAQREGDTKKIVHLATWLVELKDSLTDQRAKEQIAELQLKFDNNLAMSEQKDRNFKLLSIVCVLFLVVIIGGLTTKIKHDKSKKKLIEKENTLLEKEKLIDTYQKNIQSYQLSGKVTSKTIDCLSKKVEYLQKYKDNYKLKGHTLYVTVQKGESIKDWNKRDFLAFLDYYISIDIEYSLSLEEYEELTPRERVFLILQHEKKSESKIAEMMGISNTALRTAKCRIKMKIEKAQKN